MQKNIVFLPAAACETLYAALRAINARCDGAHERDGEGFAKLDVQPAALLLGSHPSVWTDEERLRAATLGRKYQKQAASLGHDLSGVLNEYVVEAVLRIHTARRVQRAKVAKGHIRFAKDGRIVLETPFSDELLHELRALIQGRWDASAKHWHCAPCLQNVQKCELIAPDFGVKLPEDWAARIKGIQPRGAISVGSGVIRISEFSRLEWPGHVWGFVGNTVLFEKSVCVKWDIGGTSESGTLPATSWNLERLQALIERSPELHFLRNALEKPFKRGIAVAARIEDRRWVRSDDLALGEVARQALLARLPASALERGVMAHQLAGIRSLLELPDALLADEQGIGKTMQALLAVELAGHYPLIVVCPAVAA